MERHIFQFIIILLFPVTTIFSQQFLFQENNPFGLKYHKPDSTEAVLKLLFYDVDSDGDQDVIAYGLDSVDNTGNLTYDKITYFMSLQENIGDKWNPIFADRKPFIDNFPYPNGYFFPSIADLNNDDKADLYVTAEVDVAGNISPLYYERKALTGDDQFNIIDANSMQLHSFIGGSFFMPELADMDKDGDFDILLSGFLQDIDPNTTVEQQPIFMYAKNLGTKTQPSFRGWYQNPYGLAPSIDQPLMSVVGDIDNDDDNDIFSLTTLDTFIVFKFFPNIPQPDGRPWFQPGIVSPFGLPSANQSEFLSLPTLVDIDADGDLDLFFVQELSGGERGIAFYKNDICTKQSENINQTICKGESFTIENNTFTTAGEYDMTITTPDNCDKKVHLNLTVVELNNEVIQTQETLSSNASDVSYQWFDCSTGLDIVEATSQSFTPIATGSYGVRVTDNNGCKNTSSCYTFIVTKTKESEFAGKISLFPNPTSDAVTIINKNNGKLSKITFINNDGKKVKNIDNAQSKLIDISDLPSGNYSIEIICERNKVVKKLTIVR